MQVRMNTNVAQKIQCKLAVAVAVDSILSLKLQRTLYNAGFISKVRQGLAKFSSNHVLEADRAGSHSLQQKRSTQKTHYRSAAVPTAS
ncbi:unnamed protein product [Arctia plantaginis]|uniref:Uncharacterized protein n=1 Tax=Arctia plantaginis TaxID=874455 RepID=A0A8S1BC72_ARCPL|nr:unnamed protein product [Arctia plantaginis]